MSPVQLEVSWNQREFFFPDSLLGCLPAEGLNTPWLWFVSANIYHSGSAAGGVTAKSPVGTAFNKVIHSPDWLSSSTVRDGQLWGTRGGDRTWHYCWAKNRYSSLSDSFGWWCPSFKVLILVLLGGGNVRSPWADSSDGIFPENFSSFHLKATLGHIKIWRLIQHFHSKSNFLHLIRGQINIQSVPKCFN